MKRITIDDLKAAIEKVKVPLLVGSFSHVVDDKFCGCPQTILYLAAHDYAEIPTNNSWWIHERFGGDVHAWAMTVYGDGYAFGFRAGFDNPESMENKWNFGTTKPGFTDGFVDGKLVREHFNPQVVNAQ